MTATKETTGKSSQQNYLQNLTLPLILGFTPVIKGTVTTLTATLTAMTILALLVFRRKREETI